MPSQLPDTLTDWLANTRAEHRELFIKLHELLLSVEPGFEIALKWRNPGYSVNGNLLMYLADQANYVQLGFYNGAEFDDPHGLIEGTGKRLRHIKVSSVDGETEAKLRDSIAASVAAGSSYRA